MSYQAVILTVSDSCAAGTRTDTSGPAIRAIPVAMWVEGLKSTPRAMLSRAVAGTRGHTLVLNASSLNILISSGVNTVMVSLVGRFSLSCAATENLVRDNN